MRGHTAQDMDRYRARPLTRQIVKAAHQQAVAAVAAVNQKTAY
jgi:hypothetical protein